MSLSEAGILNGLPTLNPISPFPLTYKKTTENIPEAGGKMEVEQIVSV